MGLCAIVMDQMKVEPDDHSIYLFYGERCDRIRVLLREPEGYVLLYKRLVVVHGKYRWPRNSSEVKPITWQTFVLEETKANAAQFFDMNTEFEDIISINAINKYLE